jgi:3-hydroxymyristoyl/3-hydroxydecanoyl-(acyl carrier protein) dehydratase
MPGTLMYECCLHTLRVFLTRMGWVAEEGAAVWEPVPGVAGRLRCRGQVIASTKKVWYEVEIKELGYGPEPFAIADALMYADGKPVVEMIDMSLRLSGTTREEIEAIWRDKKSAAAKAAPLFDRDRILAFAIGKPSEAFGDRYRVFDEERVIARLPGPPYQFLDRIVSIENCRPWEMKAGGRIVAEYDVPPEEWYFEANGSSGMPFGVLLEIALQPCGWLAAYVGSALTSDIDLSFRNLGGRAVQLEPVGRRVGTLKIAVAITKVAASAGMIIQNYDYRVTAGGRPIYEGDTYFGFFSKASLANQVGVRDAASYNPTSAEAADARRLAYPSQPPFPDERLRMIDEAEVSALRGGPAGLGWARGRKRVDPSEWFFKAHFHQDPVCPGSLGLESLLQLGKLLWAERWGAPHELGFQAVTIGREHRWTYRGQVVPKDRETTVMATVGAVDERERTLTLDGLFSVDGRNIYLMHDFTVGPGAKRAGG